jgi:hypothetical protein
VWWSNQEVIVYCRMPWFSLLAHESIWKLRWHNLLMGLKTLNQFGVKLLFSHIETCCMKLLRWSNPLYFVKVFDPDQAHKYQHDNKSLCIFSWFLIQCENNSTILEVTSGELRLNHRCGLKLANNPYLNSRLDTSRGLDER